MNAKDRIMAVLRHEPPDIIPVTTYLHEVAFIGFAMSDPWRKLIDKGIGLHLTFLAPVYKCKSPHVKMEIIHHYNNTTSWSPVDILNSMQGAHDVSGIISTPKGDLKLKTHWQSLSLTEIPWFPEDGYVIKDLSDYEKLMFIIEDTEYIPDYEQLKGVQMMVGNHGVVPAFLPKSPIQSMIQIMGYRRFSLDYYTERKKFEELYRMIYKKEIEVYKIAAEAPTELVWAVDNVNGQITTPKIFEQYNIPFYNEVADIIHKHDKIYVVHMDGLLSNLSDLIPKTKIDAIESFTPPPMGDLPLKEARKKWKDKVIWANFPETITLYGKKAVKQKTLEMLKDVAPGDNFILGASESFPSALHELDALTTILRTVNKYGAYPISVDS
ncbi:MAG: uroporphyrinogen decarboxylase family protein [Candidatus Helarchaeota archaeon]